MAAPQHAGSEVAGSVSPTGSPFSASLSNSLPGSPAASNIFRSSFSRTSQTSFSTNQILGFQFEEDIAEGMMIKISLRDFKARYGEHRAIAVLAVIFEDEAIGKKQMIHDATHGVRVNHQIRCRDKIRAETATREMMEAKQVAFFVVGEKAHRRFKHREEEHGYLG